MERIFATYHIETMHPLERAAMMTGEMCHALSHDTRIDGIEISLKGGQNGGDYFGAIQRGHA